MELPLPATLDRLADRGWPALEREELGPWALRAAGGVTNRANSVLAIGDPGSGDIGEAVDAAERWYAMRALPTVFQVSPASSDALVGELERRGYREHSETGILVAERAAVAATLLETASGDALDAPSDVSVAASPPRGWLDTWWAVDGRGGASERATVESILAGGPALYAWAGASADPDAVARLALAEGWGGLYAVATLPRARRRGLARRLAVALAEASGSAGVERLWLQVVAGNAAALALYEGLGFTPSSRYSYWEQGR
ncbi:N-acetyltransferase [Leifsonia sp. LS1]|uniref:GNAT family N-acetyltransferase n=1 Tax=Leifsonia sp. LS1 TaxID=2828483 RepID=UPI001CFEA8B8|nr:GNAT family N-acetyltransferase [Leifsonia sp. LS1]GIT78865.1 N-acetyltransferase [Leifsonia sp. LS1]